MRVSMEAMTESVKDNMACDNRMNSMAILDQESSSGVESKALAGERGLAGGAEDRHGPAN